MSKYMIYREPCLFSYLPSHCLCNLGLEFLHLHVRVHVHGEVIEFLQAANTMTHTHTRGYVQDSTCRYEDTSEELYNVSLYTAVSPSARSVDTHSHTHTHTSIARNTHAYYHSISPQQNASFFSSHTRPYLRQRTHRRPPIKTPFVLLDARTHCYLHTTLSPSLSLSLSPSLLRNEETLRLELCVEIVP